MGAISGSEYIRRIDELQSEVWLAGKKVEGRISEHPSFSGVIKSQANLYDLQLSPGKQGFMTFPSPLTGNAVGTSFLVPKSKDDLELRRRMIQEWAKTTAGMMGRSPDYMNTALMAFAAAADIFAVPDRPFAQNLANFFEEARENDYSFTHTFISPQVNRSNSYTESKNKIISAQAVKTSADGVVIKGGRLLATQGGVTDEILVFPTKDAAINKDCAFAFSIPSNTPGLKFLCRESFCYSDSGYNHPLGSRFDEIDTIVVFDDVLVPWERVFCFQNPEASYKIFSESSFYPLAAHQVTARRIIKTEFVLGVAQLLVDTINIGEYQHIQQKITELILGLETMKALLTASEVNAKFDRWGTMVPDFQPLSTACILFAKMYPRFGEILQLIGASGLVSLPGEEDFDSEIGNDLGIYLQAANTDAYERVRIFRLAWDICMSAFGSRQILYERFFFGDPVRMESSLYHMYDKSRFTKNVKEFLGEDSH